MTIVEAHRQPEEPFELHLYCHIPFCVSRCPFCCYMCSFAVDEITDRTLIEKYVSAMVAEIKSTAATERPYRSVVFGGGTPTLLERSHIEGILAALRSAFPRPSSNGVIMSFETSPETGTPERLETFRSQGFGRLSLGAQALNDHDLHLLKRTGLKSQIEKAYENARHADFHSVNIDVMMGFPGHAFENWAKTLREVIAFEPDSVSINPFLSGMGGLAKYVAALERRGHAVPPINERARMLGWAFQELRHAGYAKTVNLVFSKPGHGFSYISDTFSTTHNVRAFGAGIKSFEDDSLVLSDTGIRQYVGLPGSGRHGHPYRNHFATFVRNGLIAHGRVDSVTSASRMGVSLQDGFRRDTVTQEFLEQLLQNRLCNFSGDELLLNEERLCEALLFVESFFDEHWS